MGKIFHIPNSSILCLLCLLGLLQPSTASAAGNKRPPNVIVVITDDQGYGDLGCHGNKHIKTPNMDKLYAKSIRFTNFHVDPTCSPSRSALMTGRYSGRVGVWHTIMGRSILRADEVTMADYFSASGYVTGIFGKWHLGDNYPFRPQDRGFQEVFVHGGGGVGQTPDYFGNNYFDDTYFYNGKAKEVTGYCTDVWFTAAMDFMKRNKQRPFFTYLTTNAPHGPYIVGEKYSNLYKGNKKVPNANFYGMITNIDDNMGKLYDFLREENLEQDTILIFMTDNGSAVGAQRGGFNAGMRGRKGSEYDGGHRVPCFVYWPGGNLKGGKDFPPLTAHIDLLPTLISLCKLKTPEGVKKFDGNNLQPQLVGNQKPSPRRTLVVESQRIEHPKKYRKFSVMTDRWRLVNGEELYDITADPGQKTDISNKHPKMVKALRNHYEKWWKDVSAESHHRYSWIVLGSEKENPAKLTCHDWHESSPPWNQSHIRRGVKANGFWTVEVERPGQFEFQLRRWPKEHAKPINEGKGIKAATAKLKIFDKETVAKVKGGAKYVSFQLPLPKGQTRLQTWLINEDGQSRGAYYVYVRRLKK